MRRVRLTGRDGRQLAATVAGEFTREECARPRTGAPTFRAAAADLFDAIPAARRAWLMSSPGLTLFFLAEAGGRWWDMARTPVQVEEVG